MFAFSYDSCCSFVNYFIFLFFKVIIFITCYFKDSQNLFIQSLPLCISCLLSMLLNDDIVDIEKWYIVTNEMTSSINTIFLNFLPFVELEEPSCFGRNENEAAQNVNTNHSYKEICKGHYLWFLVPSLQ